MKKTTLERKSFSPLGNPPLYVYERLATEIISIYLSIQKLPKSNGIEAKASIRERRERDPRKYRDI